MIEDIADKQGGDLGAASQRRVRYGTTDTQSMDRKVNYVVMCLLNGTKRSRVLPKLLSGADAEQVRFRVWKRAHKNAMLALALDDEWKRSAKLFRDNSANPTPEHD